MEYTGLTTEQWLYAYECEQKDKKNNHDKK